MSETSFDRAESTSSSEFVTINVEETLRFFDEKPDWSIKQATGVVGVVGEDLNAACFNRYVESNGAKVTVRTDPVTTGRRKGPRLDRWIVVDWPDRRRTVFQTEIKNWSAHAIGGDTLSVPAKPKQLAAYKQRRWDRHWDSQLRTLKTHAIAKVLVPMKPPVGLEKEDILPLLIFWEALGPTDQPDSHLFNMSGPTCDFPFEIPSTWPDPHEFPELWVFSVSSYLRSIPDACIELRMPVAADRLRILKRLFSNT